MGTRPLIWRVSTSLSALVLRRTKFSFPGCRSLVVKAKLENSVKLMWYARVPKNKSTGMQEAFCLFSDPCWVAKRAAACDE